MPPLDMQACGASGESCMNSSGSSSLRTLVDAAASTLGGHEDVAGERRRTRALKLRQTRTRNAARVQAYTSAEDSDEEEDDCKPDVPVTREEAPADEVLDIQAWKKQQRMIRNRESAALSRKRKRDRIESLEQQVERLAAEVNRLADENRGLRDRLESYEPSILHSARHGRGHSSAGSGSSGGSGGKKRGAVGANGGAEGRARHGTSTVSCLNSRESAVETAAHCQQRPNTNGRSNACSPVSATKVTPSSISAAPSTSPISIPEPSGSMITKPLLPPIGPACPGVVKAEVPPSDSGESSSAVADGYTSPCTTEESSCSPQLKPMPGPQHQQGAMLYKDDDDACDDLLMDILSGNGAESEGFFSLLDDVPSSSHGSSPHVLGSLGSFVKQEIEF